MEDVLISSSGVLIGGGHKTGDSAEFYIPNMLHCQLPDLPSGRSKARHLQVEEFLCGGWGNPWCSSCGDPEAWGEGCVREVIQ